MMNQNFTLPGKLLFMSVSLLSNLQHQKSKNKKVIVEKRQHGW